ncbi:BrnT family toxin [Amorphus orientalis]|uniref:Uncharacterized DUF497 family protein n=1 Tax=Amorphus orientalis TaxID=649198 RepID=A0AAE4ASB0_9HYPH|nr:BrnT family toxin [Amorphus orientalis]MDQ0314835.1 uncharacterized DUF497 family protein [Amorphus orientalis]
MDTPRTIDFDDAKEAENIAKHGVSFNELADFAFETAMVEVDDRHDYGERREVALGFIGHRLHVLVFTMRDETLRAISLRKANRREMRTYDDHQAED